MTYDYTKHHEEEVENKYTFFPLMNSFVRIYQFETIRVTPFPRLRSS